MRTLAVLAAAAGLGGCGIGAGRREGGRRRRPGGHARLRPAAAGPAGAARGARERHRDAAAPGGQRRQDALRRRLRVVGRRPGRARRALVAVLRERHRGRQGRRRLRAARRRRGAVGLPLGQGAPEHPRHRGRVPRAVRERAWRGASSPSGWSARTREASPCERVKKTLRDAGVPATGSALGTQGTQNVARVVVATWDRAREQPTIRALEQGPKRSAVFARFSADGDLTLLDERGRAGSRRRPRRRPGGRAAPARRPAGVGGHGRLGEGRCPRRPAPSAAPTCATRSPWPRPPPGPRSPCRPGRPGEARLRTRLPAAAEPAAHRRRGRDLRAVRGVRAGLRAVPAPAGADRDAGRAIVGCAAAAGVGEQLLRALRITLPLGLLIGLINPLVYNEGATVLLRRARCSGTASTSRSRPPCRA